MSTASWDRATPTSPKRNGRSPAGLASTAWPGPSELAIVADGHVDIDMAALDLIAQAEHDPEARTFLVSPDADLIERISKALGEALEDAGRREIVDAALRYTKAVLVRDLDQAADVVNDLAAEHLQLLIDDPDAFLPQVRNAGAVFLGRWTAVPFGDYGVASNHVLPTAGTARFSSGLRAADYVTVSSFVQMDARRRSEVRTQAPPRSPRRRAWSVTRAPWTHARDADRSGGAVSPAAEPRPGVRDVEPYVSPQLDVPVRLNTNECPHPLPQAFADELAEGVRDLPLNRYPDGQMTQLREALAAHTHHPFEGTWISERLERGAHRAPPGVRRTGAESGGVRTDVRAASRGSHGSPTPT